MVNKWIVETAYNVKYCENLKNSHLFMTRIVACFKNDEINQTCLYSAHHTNHTNSTEGGVGTGEAVRAERGSGAGER